MSDHNILSTAGYGQLAQPAVALLETRRFGDPVRVLAFDAGTAEVLERRVFAACTDSSGELRGTLKALE
jgi:hypothetical protein